MFGYLAQSPRARDLPGLFTGSTLCNVDNLDLLVGFPPICWSSFRFRTCYLLPLSPSLPKDIDLTTRYEQITTSPAHSVAGRSQVMLPRRLAQEQKARLNQETRPSPGRVYLESRISVLFQSCLPGVVGWRTKDVRTLDVVMRGRGDVEGAEV